MKYLYLIFFLVSSSVFAQDSWRKVCYMTQGDCFAVSHVGSTRTIFIPQSVFDSDNEMTNAFVSMNYSVAPFTPGTDQTLIEKNAVTENRDLVEDSHILSDIPDEQWNLMMTGSTCLVSAGMCAGGYLGALETGGMSLMLSRASCGLAAISCVNSLRDWEKWNTWKHTAEQKKALSMINSHQGPGEFFPPLPGERPGMPGHGGGGPGGNCVMLRGGEISDGTTRWPVKSALSCTQGG